MTSCEDSAGKRGDDGILLQCSTRFDSNDNAHGAINEKLDIINKTIHNGLSSKVAYTSGRVSLLIWMLGTIITLMLIMWGSMWRMTTQIKDEVRNYNEVIYELKFNIDHKCKTVGML